MPRALITGITGQDGRYLAEFLHEKGYVVFGLVAGQGNPKADTVTEELPFVDLIGGDLQDLSSLIAAIEYSQPDEVYNLGSISFVPLSFKQPELTANVTGLGVLRMLEAIRVVGGSQDNPMKFYQASSSEMFGKVRETPQNEKTAFHPRSPYGVAKVFGHHATVNYREAYNLFAVSGILFNHESVPFETPVVVRRNGLVDVTSIGDVVPHKTDRRHGKTYSSDGRGLEVWDGEGWSRCTARSATWRDDELVTIHGRGAVLEATDDHVVLLHDGERKASEVLEGDNLLLSTQPMPTFATTMSEDEAWLLGILTAEGYVSEDGSGRITCGDESALAEAASCWSRVTAGYSRKADGPSSAFSNRRTAALELLGNGAYLRMVRPELYTRKGDKRIPIRVLNAAPSLQLAYLTAYNLGDGLRAGHGTDFFKSFRTASAPLAAGLIWLARTVLGRRVSVYLQPGKLGVRSYLINLGSGQLRGDKGAHLRRPQPEVRRVERRPFSGWTFDLATESGRFAAGVGLTIIHNSPRRGPEFVTRKASIGVARIKLGLQSEIVFGELDSKRDWGFAGDYVRAMWMMLQRDEPDDYVIATGKAHSVRECVQLAFRAAGIDDWERYVSTDQRFHRPSEVHALIGDATKARTELGWEPQVSFEELMAMMVDHDLKHEAEKAERRKR